MEAFRSLAVATAVVCFVEANTAFSSPNRVFVRSYNVVALPLAAGLLKPSLGMSPSPALAALFMAFSSTLVVLSSLGLKLYTRPGEPTAFQTMVIETRICSSSQPFLLVAITLGRSVLFPIFLWLFFPPAVTNVTRRFVRSATVSHVLAELVIYLFYRE